MGRPGWFAAVGVLFALPFCSLETRSQTTATPPASGVAEVNDTRLYYETAGQGHPLVFLHGGQLDGRMWDDQWETFAKHFRVIRYDVRGFGRSAVRTKLYSAVDDLCALLKFLKVEKAYLVGLSLGGRIAIDFTLVHPEMVDALVPVGAGLGGFEFGDDSWFWPVLEAAQAGDLARASELWLKSGYVAPAMENPALAARLRKLSGAGTVVIPGAGHVVNMEKPENSIAPCSSA